MANTVFKLRRSSVAGKVPTTSDIAIGELAINLTDRKLYSSDGSNTWEIGANNSTVNVTNSITVATNSITNSSGIFTNSINAASHTVGTAAFVANTSGVYTNNNINLTNNDRGITFTPLAGGANVGFRQQSDDNFVFYSTNTTNGQRAIFNVYANTNSGQGSAFRLNVPFDISSNPIYANNSVGSAGQVLASNGSATYWTTVTGTGTVTSVGSGTGLTGGPITGSGTLSVNTGYNFTWSNTHTFQANVSFSDDIGIPSNNAIYFGGLGDANWRMARNSNILTKWIYTNNTIDIVTANSPYEGFAIGLVSNATYFETGYLGTYVAKQLVVGDSSVNTTINATSFTGTANNSSYLGGNLPAYYTNASNITTGTLPYAQLGTNVVNTTGSFTLSGVTTFNADVTLGSSGLSANGSYGSFGQSLLSNGSSTYWATAGATLNANNTDTQTFYIGLSNTSSGAWTNAVVSTSKLSFVPSTGTLTVGNNVYTTTSVIVGNSSANATISSDSQYLLRDLTSESGNVFSHSITTTRIQNQKTHSSNLKNVSFLSRNEFYLVTNEDVFNSNNYSSKIYANTTYLSIGSNSVNISINSTSINASSFTVGTAFTANATVVNAVSYYAGTTLIGNTTGPYGKTEINLNVNNSVTSNTATYLGNSSGTTANFVSWITGNSATAYTNAVSYTDGKILTANAAITGNAATAYTNSVSYTDGKIATANSAITGNAATAYTNAVSYVDGLKLDSVTNTSITLIPVANTVKNAYDRAIDANTRAASAQTAAASAYTNSVSYTDGKIATANSAITGNAATAYTNAVSYTDSKIATANAAITGNAATAYTNAITFASNATNINTGTLAEARLPYRMDQNVRTTDSPTFSALTLTGSLNISGNVNVVGANTLSVVDNFIYLNSNNTIDNEDIGIVANYNSTGNSLGYAHTGIFRDASDGTWKIFDGYKPEPDANVNIDTTNTTFQLANFQANTLYLGNTSTNWLVSNTGGTYITGTVNAASHTVGTAFTANATVVNAVSYYAGTTLIGNTTGPYGKTEGSLNVNSATQATNTTNLNSQPGSYYTNATNITTGTLPYAQLGSAVVNTSGSFTLAGNTTFSANVFITGSVVNAVLYTTGSPLTGTGGLYTNTTTLIVGNNTINTTITSAGLTVNGASVVNSSVVNSAAHTIGSTFIANTTGIYHTGTVNAAIHQTGSPLTGTGGLYANVTTLIVGNNTINTTITSAGLTVNGASVVNSSVVNAASHTIGTAFIANTTGLYHTGTVNAASHTTGATGTGTGGLIANTTVIFLGNNTINAAVNTTTLYIGGNVIANSTGANNAFNLGGTAAASYQLNSTLNANIASYLPTYTGVVNGSSHTVGTSFTANSTVVNAVSYYAGSTLIGNTTGPYGKTEINLNVNSSLTANNSTNLGGTAAASYQLNSTLNANIASYLPTYTGTVNAAIHQTGAPLTGTGGLYANVTNLIVGNNTINSALTSTEVRVGGTLIANATGPYGKTEGSLNVNSATQATNATNLNSQPGSYYTNATNITTGTLPYAQIPANIVNTTANFTIAGNTTFSANVFVTGALVNAVLYTTGSPLTGTGGVYANTTTLIVGNNTINTSITSAGLTVNGASVVNSSVVNSAAHTIGSTFIANTTGLYHTGTVNAASHTTGATGTGTGGLVANTTIIFFGNNTINAAVNTTTLYIGGNVIANSTGANNAFNLGGTAAASYQLNSTLNANIASYLPTYTGTVNGAIHQTGAPLTGTGGVYANVTNLIVGNNTINSALTSTEIRIGGTLIGNSTGPYGKTEGNLNVNSALTANNSTNLGGTAAAGYQTTAGLSANVATLTANNSTNLGGQAAAYYTNATNISTGTLSAARGGTNSSLTPVSGGVVYSNATGMAITAAGTNTFVLASNGTAPVFTQIDMAYLPEATFKKSCRAATTADLSAASATAQVLTGGLVAFPAQDGITLVLNDRLLVKNQSNTAQNGIFYVSNTGSAAVYAWTLTRATDANSSSRIASSIVAIDEGTTNGGRLFDNDFKTTDTIGTTAMVWKNNIDTGGGVFTGSVYPSSNTLLLGNSISRWVVSANTVDASGLITGAGGATITGTTNTSTAFQISTTFIANTTGVYHTGTMNAASHTVGTSTIANSTGVYTGVVNAASHTVGTAFTANATVVNAVSYYAGTTLIGNTTGPYGKTEATLNVNSALTANNSTNLGGTAAASYQLNSTLNANIAAYLPVYTGVVNGSSHTVSTSFIANTTGVYHTGTMNAASHTVGSSFIANSTAIVGTGYANVTTSVNSALLTVGSSFIANTTGAYHTGTVNAASHTVGSNFIANSTAIVGTGYANVTTSVNSALLTVGSSFIANTTGAYHTGIINAASHTTGGGYGTATGGAVVNASFIGVGNSTINSYSNSSSFTSEIGFSNRKSLDLGTYTTDATLNTVIVGPYTISTGNSIVVTSGSRVVII